MALVACSFRLNGSSMSKFICGGFEYDAFSGLSSHVNKPDSAWIANQGPIPPGRYYIVDRPSGGTLGGVRDWWTGRDQWFALFADDGSIDDTTSNGSVTRGQFRLHPPGPLGISQGCITLNSRGDFVAIREYLLQHGEDIQGANGSIRAYGVVTVTA